MKKQGWMFLLAMTASAVPAAAADSKLNVKPGLWETSMVMNMSGMPQMPAIAPEQLAKMPPEQRAKLEAMMKNGSMLGGKPQTSKSCITAEQLKKGPAFDEGTDPTCKRTIVSNSSSQWEMLQECAGTSQRRVSVKYQAVNAETINGQMEMSSSQDGRTISGTGTLQSKWLGADCGSVKPDSNDEARR